MRVVDILAWHDNSTGPAGVPARCVEHDGSRQLGAGETRLTADEYRAQQPVWAAAYETWMAQQPPQPSIEPVPFEVTNFQARAVLLNIPSSSGVQGRTLFHDVDDAIRSLGPTAPAYQAWEYANTITRHGATVQTMATQFGLTEAQLDQMFRNAALIEA
jgi:hypothetical protein